MVSVHEAVLRGNDHKGLFNLLRLKYLFDRFLVKNSGFFDPYWYCAKYPELKLRNSDGLTHFMSIGASLGLSPGPKFAAAWYLAQYPDVASVNANPLVHYLRHGKAEGRLPMPGRDIGPLPKGSKAFVFMSTIGQWLRGSGKFSGVSVSARVNSFAPTEEVMKITADLLASIGDLDPDLYADDRIRNIEGLAMYSSARSSSISRAFQDLFNRLSAPYDFIITVPWLTHSGADKVAINALRALVDIRGTSSTLFLVTDGTRIEAEDWLPDDAHIQVLAKDDLKLTDAERTELFILLVRALRPTSILNVNSRVAWQSFRHHGSQLSRLTRLYGTAFCRDYDIEGNPGGYADTHLRHALPWLDGIYFDNLAFSEELTKKFSLPNFVRQKYSLLYQPVEIEEKEIQRTRRNDSRTKIFWASRIADQKAPELLLSIVINAPQDWEFHIYGSLDLRFAKIIDELISLTGRVTYHGEYANIASIPTYEADAFLYTSKWDGLPNILLEIGARGIPIVASSVGGVSELVNSQTGWLVDPALGAEGFILAITRLLEQPDDVRARTSNMLELIKTRHSWGSYLQSLEMGGLLEKPELTV